MDLVPLGAPNLNRIRPGWGSNFNLLCGPLRISAFSALKGYFNTEPAEIRRGAQREI